MNILKSLDLEKLQELIYQEKHNGIVKKTENITESDLATISFGQTNTVTASTIYGSI